MSFLGDESIRVFAKAGMLAGLHGIYPPQLLQQGLLQQRCAGSCACGSAFVWIPHSSARLSRSKDGLL